MEAEIAALEKLGASGGVGSYEGNPLASDRRISDLRAEVKAMGLDAGLPNDLDPFLRVRDRIR